eukprot:403368205
MGKSNSKEIASKYLQIRREAQISPLYRVQVKNQQKLSKTQIKSSNFTFQIIDKHKINNKVPYSTILTGKTLQDHLKSLSPEKIGLKLKSLNQSQSPCVEDMVGNHSKSTKYEIKDVLSDTSQDIKNMAYQMSQRQLLQQQNLVQPGPFYERQIPSSFVNALNPNSIFQTQQQKLKTATSQTRGTQQPQQIQHKMSQKRLADELKQLNRKADNNLVNNGGGANQNALNNSNQNISNAEIQNLSAKLQSQLPITSLGRNSQQGIYQNMQIRTTPGIYNNIQSKTHYNNGFQGLNASGYLGYNLDKSLMMSSNGYQQMNQNTTLGFINNKNGLNISSQSIERPTSQQSNANQRKNQSFLTPQRQAKFHEITKGKKLILKPNQIQKNQQSPQSQYLLNHAQAGVSNLTAKDKVLMDKKTYEELMNYLVKVECKRIERDKNQSNHYQNQNLQSNVQLIGKRPNSTLKRLAAGVPGGNLERLSHNPKPFNQNRDLMFNPLQNNFNNSSFLSAAPTSLGRNSKLSKTPQKKLLQPQKLKNIIQQNNQAQLSSEDRGINQSSSLRQIKRNNYVNELTSAYNHQTEILNKSSVTPGQQPGQVSSFFNVNQSQSIPTSKKGTQKKIILQDTMVQEYQQMTQPKLQQLLQSGKFSQYKNAMINPQNVYMTDKIQSARGAFKGTGKELINVSAPSKISNLLMHKDKQIKIGGPIIQNNIGILQPESKMPMSQRDNSVGSKQASSRQNQNNQNMIIIQQEPQQKLNKAQEVSLVKRLTSAKSKKDPKDKNQINDLEEKSIDQNTIELDSQRRQNIQLDSDLLYGSKVAKNNNLHVILKDQISGNDVYVIDHSDHKNFDTFGDSEKNKKVTAVSELHSPDHNARSPKNPQQHQSKQLQPNIRSSIPHKLENDPYQNQSYVEQEFHYSGSFGVPMTLQNQSYQIDANNKLVQSYINQGQNLSFSIVGQNDMSIISQEQLQSNHHAYIDNKGAIIIEDNENEYISKEHNEYDDNDEEVQQIIDQPFYLQDYQEEYFETDKLSEPLKSTLSPQSKDSVNKNDLSSIDNSTVEAVKKKLINDPDYRRELLERVLPQFSKLNEQFTNSFLYRLKYSNETSSLNSNSIQKSNQSTQRQTQKVLQQTQSQQSLNTKTSQPQQFLNFQDNLVHQNDFEFNDIHTFDQRRGTDVAIISSQNLSNEGAAYELLQKINLNFNRGNLNTISSSQRRDGELDRNSTTQNMQDFLMDTDGNLLLIEQICDDDETNTVIENECENDYTDIYQSIGEDDFETEELRKKREFEYQKMQLKREIMMVAGSSNQNQKFLHVMVRRNS